MREKRMLGMFFTMLFLLLITGMRAEAETINYEDGSRYEGTVVNGKRQGFGIFYRELNNENTIERYLKDVMEGEGLSTDNVRTEGFWYNDVQQGPGIIIIQIEEAEFRCEGFWSDGEMSGAFLLRHGNGNTIISSSMQDGLTVSLGKEGNILMTALLEGGKEPEAELVSWTGDDGIAYYAESKADIVGGKGIAVDQDGSIYIGEFLYGQPEGTGVFYWKSGNWYSGSFHEGKTEGTGIKYFVPGEETVYGTYTTGYWEEGQIKGGVVDYKSDGLRLVHRQNTDEREIGVVIYPDGTKKVREWDENGKASNIEDETWTDSAGNICVGEQKGGSLDGYGLIIDNETIYIGYAVNGLANGIGYGYGYQSNSGRCYEGEWKDGLRNGNGKVYWSKGDSYQGMFVEGRRSEGRYMFKNGNSGWYEGTFDKNEKLFTGSRVKVLEDGSRDVIVYENGDVQENPGVTIYKDTGYSGRYAVFEPGEYHMADMVKRGISNDSITSITIPEGYSITVYHNDDFSGIRHRYTSDVDFYITGEDDQTRWNDSVSSFIVEKTGQE